MCGWRACATVDWLAWRTGEVLNQPSGDERCHPSKIFSLCELVVGARQHLEMFLPL